MSNEHEKAPITILVTNEGMGTGDPELRLKLMKSFLALMNENNVLPSVICFYTDGVKLVIEDSTVLSELRSLEEKGVRLIVCQTCLNHYGVMEKLEVGIVGGMTDIIEAQWRADKVLTI
jgi:selenium metabolism protein YedF